MAHGCHQSGSLHELLVAGEVDLAARKPKSLWSNRLVLPGFDAIDHAKFHSAAKIEAASETTSLRARHLEGAVLIGAKLRKADFTAAQLRGSQFDRSDLRGAKFECATFDPNPQQCAQLQGTWFYGADLEGAELRNVHVWRTDARQAWPKDNTYVEYQEIGPTYKCDGLIGPSDCDQLANAFEKLEQLITDQVPEGRLRSEAMKRIEDSLNPTKALEGEDEMAKVWWEAHPAREVYEERVAKIWRETGCATEGAPYVLPRLLLRLESSFAPSGPQLPELAKAFLDEEHCPGAHGLSDTDKAKLKEIRDRSPPPASKP